jgi:hypothetical protein
LPIERLSDFQESASLRAKVLNDELDYLTATVQQVAVKADRSITLCATDADASLTLPKKEARSNQLLGFDDQGNVVTSDPIAATPPAPVQSVFGRAGTINAAAGDYHTGQITETSQRIFFTPAERTKLTSIEPHATADMSGSEIVSAISAEFGSTAWQSGGTGAVSWGGIGGNIGDQSDLSDELTAVTDAVDAVQGNLDSHALSRSGHPLATTDGDGLMSADDKTKLVGIETAANVTDAQNVKAAGAVMASDTTTVGMGFVLDEDDMASNSATKIPTQQSVKAYVDATVNPAGMTYLVRPEAVFAVSANHAIAQNTTTTVAFDNRTWIETGAVNFTTNTAGEITIPEIGTVVFAEGYLSINDGGGQSSLHVVKMQTNASGAWVDVPGAAVQNNGGYGESTSTRNGGGVPFAFGPFTTTVSNEQIKFVSSQIGSSASSLVASRSRLEISRRLSINGGAGGGSGHGTTASVTDHGDVPDTLNAGKWWRNTDDGSGVAFVDPPTSSAAGTGRELQYNDGAGNMAAVPNTNVNADGYAFFPQLMYQEELALFTEGSGKGGNQVWQIPNYSASWELQHNGGGTFTIDCKDLQVPDNGHAYYVMIIVRNTDGSNDSIIDVTNAVSKSVSMPYTLPAGYELPVTLKVARNSAGNVKVRSWIGGLGA